MPFLQPRKEIVYSGALDARNLEPQRRDDEDLCAVYYYKSIHATESILLMLWLNLFLVDACGRVREKVRVNIYAKIDDTEAMVNNYTYTTTYVPQFLQRPIQIYIERNTC